MGDLVLVRDFERDKYHGRKLDARWLGPRILTEITSSRVSRFVQELYGKEVKKYHLDDLKTYCPQAENSPTATSITQTAMSLAGFPGQRAVTLHSLFSDCLDYKLSPALSFFFLFFFSLFFLPFYSRAHLTPMICQEVERS